MVVTVAKTIPAEVPYKYTTSCKNRPSSAGKPGRLRSVRSGYRANRKRIQGTRDPRAKPSNTGEAAASVVMGIYQFVFN